MARAIVKRPKLLLADEPLAMLDEESVGQVVDVLKDFLSQGGTLIVTSPKYDITTKLNISWSKVLRLGSH